MNAVHDKLASLAEHYDKFAAVEHEVGQRLLERLVFQRSEPKTIVDLGCATGALAQQLKRQYRKAAVICLDRSPAMLARASDRSSFMRPLRVVCADMSRIPLADRCADLMVSNLAGQWQCDVSDLFAGYRRVLNPGGLLLMATLGRSSLSSLIRDRNGEICDPGFPMFEDILEVGDQLVAAGFNEPVMDTDRIQVNYSSLRSLVQDLEGTGLALQANNWNEWVQSATQADGKIVVDYEIIYGLAFGPGEGQPVRQEQGEVATFSIDSLRKSIKK